MSKRTRLWTPDEVPEKIFWLDASAPGVQDKDGLVSAIPNRAGGSAIQAQNALDCGHHFERGELLAGRPTLRATSEHDGWFFVPGSEDAISGVSGLTCIGIQRQRERGDRYSYRAILCAGRVGTTSARFIFWQDAYLAGALSTTAGFGALANCNANASEAGTDWALIVGTADWPTATTRTRINGSERARATTSVTVAANEVGLAAPLQIGARWANPTQAYKNAFQDLAELLFFGRTLSDAEVEQVEGYLAHKWGLSESLPAGHPYKAAPPVVEEWDGVSLSDDAEAALDDRAAPIGTLLLRQDEEGAFRLAKHKAQAGLALDDTLASAVLVSLFSDAPASEDEAERLSLDARRGWWADALAPADGAWGSRLWCLDRAKPSAESARQAEERAKEALSWMLDDGIADTIDAEASWVRGTSGARLELAIAIHPTPRLVSRYGELWRATYEL